MNIFVAKLGPETTGEDLRTLFEQFGTVDTAKVIFDHETGNSRGFGFVEMPVEEEGYEAVNALNDTDIHGSRVVIKEARPQGEYQPDGRGDDRGGFVPRPGGYDSNRSQGFPGGRGGYDNNRAGGGGYDNNRGGGFGANRGGGGYDNNRGGGFGGNRGGGSYDNNRGGSFGGNRGGYDNNRGGGFGGNRGGYDNNRGGGFSGNRGGGGYDNNRGGGFDRGGYDNNRGYDRGGFDRDRAPFGQNRDRFAPERRPQSREDEDLYRFEEFIGNNE